jgi:hypothetical protein
MKKWIIIGTILFIIVVVGAVLLTKACSTAGIITDPNRMVYNYEWFYNTEADAKAYSQQIVTANQQIATFRVDHANDLNTYANTTELARLESVEQGLQNELVSTCNNYDAAVGDVTRDLFRNWSLPTNLTATSDGKLIESNN